jgi:hypothetical protein
MERLKGKTVVSGFGNKVQIDRHALIAKILHNQDIY